MLREFTDKTGTSWRVYDVYPTGPSAAVIAADVADRVNAFPSRDHAQGWLCFESTSEKRRLTPIPLEWELCELKRLEELCEGAGYVSRLTPRDIDREASSGENRRPENRRPS